MCAVDLKYGRITVRHGNLGEDEPVIVLRAQDKLVPKLLAYYRLFCWKAGSPKEHLEMIDAGIERVEAWQRSNPNSVKVPD